MNYKKSTSSDRSEIFIESITNKKLAPIGAKYLFKEICYRF